MFYSARSGDLEIWLCDSEGRNPAQLTSFGGAGVGRARWSPDSRWIAFNSKKDGNTDLYVISVEGGRVRRLTTEASNEWRPSWSKDGRWIYFAWDRTGDPPNMENAGTRRSRCPGDKSEGATTQLNPSMAILSIMRNQALLGPGERLSQGARKHKY